MEHSSSSLGAPNGSSRVAAVGRGLGARLKCPPHATGTFGHWKPRRGAQRGQRSGETSRVPFFADRARAGRVTTFLRGRTRLLRQAPCTPPAHRCLPSPEPRRASLRLCSLHRVRSAWRSVGDGAVSARSLALWEVRPKKSPGGNPDRASRSARLLARSGRAAVAVGTPIAGRPPHRSRRAELPHRAPASNQTPRAQRA